MMFAGHPIVIRRAGPADAEAIHSTFTDPKVIAGTLQLPYPSIEMWRRWLASSRTSMRKRRNHATNGPRGPGSRDA